MQLVITRKSFHLFLNRISHQWPLLDSGFGTGSTGGGGGGGGNSTASASGGSPSGAPSGISMTPGAAPSGSGGGGDGAAGGGSSKINEENFLRGGWQTNDNGIVEFLTVYPGFCK